MVQIYRKQIPDKQESFVDAALLEQNPRYPCILAWTVI